MIDAQGSSSTRPYLIRALYEWCTDNGLTPYLAVQVDDSVQVPREYVKDGEIVLNVSFDATSGLEIGNEIVSFSARFAGKARELLVPVDRVIAIYARENGQGMAFPRHVAVVAEPQGVSLVDKASSVRDTVRLTEADVKLLESVPLKPGSPANPTPPDRPGSKKRPKLTRIK